MEKLRSCTKEEFEAFVAAYPGHLERDIYGACEPPLVTFNDFKRAPMWPDSVVASCLLDDQGVRGVQVGEFRSKRPLSTFKILDQ